MTIIITLLVLFVCLLGVVGLAFIFIYNSLVAAKTRVDETWRQIDVRLQNRYDLLPDLIQAVEKSGISRSRDSNKNSRAS